MKKEVYNSEGYKLQLLFIKQFHWLHNTNSIAHMIL